ncbi:MAG: hypothetical protein KBS59_00170 [Clostridiales bacterium]|nr:hypothetical protein [Clostridiales bacterium]
MWIIIVAAVIFVICGIFTVPLKLRLLSNGENTEITWKFVFLGGTIYPSKPKKKKRKKRKKTSSDGAKPAKKEKKKKSASDIVKLIKSISGAVGVLLGKLKNKLKIRLKMLEVIIGTGDAAETALIYGAAANACDELMRALEEFMNFEAIDGAVNIEADFLSENTTAKIDAYASINAFGALYVLLPTLRRYLTDLKK